MNALFWTALAFFLAAGVAAAVFVGARAWAAWQAFVSVATAAAAAAEQLEQATALLQARGEKLAGRVEDLNAAAGRLRRTQARARILLGAWGEVTSVLRAAQIFSSRT